MCFCGREKFFSKNIFVYFFNNNSLFLDNLAFFLNWQKGIRVTGKTTSIEEAHQLTKNSPPEVVILGIGMFNREGYYALSFLSGKSKGYQLSFWVWMRKRRRSGEELLLSSEKEKSILSF